MPNTRAGALCLSALLLVAPASADGVAPSSDVPRDRILTEREQATLVRRWVERRLSTVLPALMRQTGIDLWIIVSREYNDDPVFRSLAPPTTFSSRRRTILVMARRADGGVDRYSIGRFAYDDLYTLVRAPDSEQWAALGRLVAERTPARIGINMSELFSHADGLSATDRDRLIEALGPTFRARVVSAQALAVAWLQARLPEETVAYRVVMARAHDVIREAFSAGVVRPGVTTTHDVEWWMRQRVVELGLGLWFHPTVTVWRQGGLPEASRPDGAVIQPGDLLHCDFGLVYLGLSTDTQHLAYVLRDGEADAPAGLREGLRQAQRVQDLVMASARPGLTGNAVLATALQAARREGITTAIYCHPIGYHGHGAGPPIGMVDRQAGVPGRGDLTLSAGTWHSIELNVTYPVPEWGGQAVRFALEEDALLTEQGWDWIDGRQTALYLIAAPTSRDGAR